MTRLDGVGVLITRPAGRAGPLVDAIEAAGGVAVEFPVLEIELRPSPAMLHPGGKPIESGALVIFVSVYAVQALESLLRDGMSLPPAITLAAIGQATARALADMGLSADLLPEAGENSEGLLARLAALDLTHRQVVILRGQSGRELLARELGQRGARVTQISCYRRGPVASPPLDHFRRWLDLPEGVVTITSVAILEALLGVVTPTDRTALLHRPVVTLSDRIRDVCRQSGFTGPIAVARGTDPENICQAIRETRDVSDPG